MFVVLLNQLLQLLTPLCPGFPQMHCLFVYCRLVYALLCTVMPLPLLCIVLPLYFVTEEVGCILSLDGFLTNPSSNTWHGDVIAKKIAM